MKLHFLGGAMEIGGSCIYLRIAGKGILRDAGIRQSGTKDPIPDFRTIQEQGGLDAILISHAHMDHIGTLPIISKAYPQARIYMTAMTADLTRVLLYDSLKLMKNRENEIPYYSEQDVLAMLNRIHPLGYQAPFPILDGFTLTLYPAGHIAGASCIYLSTEEGTLFYSGDFSAFSQRTIEGISIPKLRPDIAIVETTYGNRLHANRQVEEKRLAELVRECILEKKKILIPVFALGRAQEVLLILRAAIQNQIIPPVPVYVDGMVREINTMYTRNPSYLKNTLGKRIRKGNEPFYTKEIQPVAHSQKRDELLSGGEPAIFLSSSGMLTGGPSAQYAQTLAASENACIIITGYQDEESPGRQLLNLLEHPGEGSLNVNGSTVGVKCRIEQVGLSAHGDKSEIMALLERLSASQIFLVHGNQEAMEELGTELASEDYRRQIFLPECGQAYELTLQSKRKQPSFQPSYTMRMRRAYTAGDSRRLWDFWQAHYPGKLFSISQIAHLWYGRDVLEESVLQTMQGLLWANKYFTPNARRFFLLEANSPEKIAAALAPKEPTSQQLTAKVDALFGEHSYRKISLHQERREILLQYDYPDAQDLEAFQAKAEDFHKATGWSLQMSPSMNHNAATLLLLILFGDRIAKTSYYEAQKRYAITLTESSQEDQDRQAAVQFQATTGWSLWINGQPQSASARSASARPSSANPLELTNLFLPLHALGEAVEQNLAFSCIDHTFGELPHKPEKKSLKQDSQGTYLELSFISPMIGLKYREQLQALADQTGWRIHLADRINQNELFKTAQLLCMKYQISLAKNPSFLPDKKILQLKPDGAPEKENQLKVAEEFLEKTGVECSFLQS